MKRIGKRGFFLFALLLIVGMSMTAFRDRAGADAGSFRGNSSYSRDSGSSSSSGSSWGSSSSSSSDGGSGSGSVIEDLFGLALAIVVLLIITLALMGWWALKRIIKKGVRSIKRKNRKDGKGFGTKLSKAEERLDAAMRERDPNFSAAAMQQMLADLYVKMQECWCEKNWEPMREHMSPQLYAQFAAQLNELEQDGLTNHMDKINVEEVTYRDYANDGVNDILTYRLTVDAIDYTLDEDGEVTVGSKWKRVYMIYEWEMIRSITAVTPGNGITAKTMECPSCGAPVDLNVSAVCSYCGSVVEAKEYGWVINRIEGIEQSDEPI